MAFLFNQIDDKLDEKKNIFAMNQDGQQMNGASPTSGGVIDRGQSQAIAFSSGGGSSSASSNQPKQGGSGSYNPQASSSTFKKLESQVTIPTGAISRSEGAFKRAEEDLQNRSNEYMAGAQNTAKGYDISRDTLEGAALGNQDAFKKTSERLTQRPKEYDAFKGLDDSEIPSAEYIRDPSSIYRDDVGPSYTAGQARLDSALLRKNKEFKRIQNSLLNREKSLIDASDKAREEKTKEARDLLTKEYDAGTERAKSTLGGLSEDVLNAARAMERQEDERRARLDAKELGRRELDPIRQKIREDLSKGDPLSEQTRALRFLDEFDDISNYINIDRDTEYDEFIDQGGAEKFNRIMGLLGRGDMVQAGQGPGKDYTVDERGAYGDLLGKISERRRAQDEINKAEMAKIRAAAEERAARYNEKISGNAKDAARQDLEAYVNELVNSYQGKRRNDYAGAANYALNELFQNPRILEGGFFQERDPITWEQALTGSDADTLSSLSEDTGLSERYARPASEFDENNTGEFNSEILRYLLQKQLERRYNTALDVT